MGQIRDRIGQDPAIRASANVTAVAPVRRVALPAGVAASPRLDGTTSARCDDLIRANTVSGRETLIVSTPSKPRARRRCEFVGLRCARVGATLRAASASSWIAESDAAPRRRRRPPLKASRAEPVRDRSAPWDSRARTRASPAWLWGWHSGPYDSRGFSATCAWPRPAACRTHVSARER